MEMSELITAIEFMVNVSVTIGSKLYPVIMGCGLFISLIRSV